MAATNASLLRVSPRPLISARFSRRGTNLPKSLKTASPPRFPALRHNPRRFRRGITAAIAVTVAPPAEEKFQECALPSWAMFELGTEPLYWKTTNGLPPTSGEKLKLFYNPAASKLEPNEDFGFAFNGGFNQSIMCGGQRAMLKKTRGKADSPIYTIQICIPKHAVNLVFSFTNGVDVDGPYRLQFRPINAWRNKPMEFFNEGLAGELSTVGACEAAIFPDSEIVVDRCSMMANLTVEGGNRCELNLVLGCMDPSSHLYNPLANVDDGSCPLDIEGEPQS